MLMFQLATAIEETLVIYHEPYFVRWACRLLQGQQAFWLRSKAKDAAYNIPTLAADAALECIYANEYNDDYCVAAATQIALKVQEGM